MAVEAAAPVGEGDVVAAAIHQAVLVVGVTLDVTRLRLVDVAVLLVQVGALRDADGRENGGGVVLVDAFSVE